MIQVDKVYPHPDGDGRLVLITSGSYLGDNGRISNFWQYREVLSDGALGKEESGYGWMAKPIPCEVIKTVKILKG